MLVANLSTTGTLYLIFDVLCCAVNHSEISGNDFKTVKNISFLYSILVPGSARCVHLPSFDPRLTESKGKGLMLQTHGHHHFHSHCEMWLSQPIY